MNSWIKMIIKKRVFAILFLLIGVAIDGYAGGIGDLLRALFPEYYYRVSVSVSPTGGGKVYLDESSHRTNADGYVNNVTYQNSYKNKDYSQNGFVFDGEAGKDLYVYAKPNNGYIFSEWTTSTENATINNPNNIYTSLSLVSSSTSSNQPAVFTITANFVKDEAKVRVDQNNRNWGLASIDPIENDQGDLVTIRATSLMPLLGVKFMYWEKTEQGGSPVRVENSTEIMTVTATSTVTTYKAYFSEPLEEEGVYCRIKNKATERYLSMYGDQQATETTEIINNNESPLIVVNSFKTVSDAVSDPSTIFYISGLNDNQQGLLHTTFKAQTVDTSKKILNNLKSISTVYSANGYKFVLPYDFDSGEVNLYLRDDDNGVRFRGSDDNYALWDIELLDEEHMETSYFGVAPKEYFCMTQEGATKYYTSLYTSFPYKLMDNVVAYWIENEGSVDVQNKKVTLKEIPTDNIVPGKRAVILECLTPGDASKNRLIPMPEEGNMDGGYHLMHGECGLNGHKINPSDFADQGAFYILSVANTNPATSAMGFYKYSALIPSNKVFVVIPKEHEAEAKTMSFVWGEDVEEGVTTQMNGLQLVLPDKKEYYDLQGRKVNHPSKGVYIVGGKKVVIK